MIDNKLYPRWQKSNILDMLLYRRVVILSGARQCGKTTLAKDLMGDNVEYRTLDDSIVKSVAENDPHGFIKHKKEWMIIDEIQRVPNLLLAIKMQVDENNRKGQFLLTGSANIQSLPTVEESLAGRVSQMRLRTLTHDEQLQSKPDFIQKLFDNELNSPKVHYDKPKLLDIACKGGFPEAISLNDRQRQRWHLDYINALLKNDLKDIANIYRQDQMQELVRILAAWSSKLVNFNQIGSTLALQLPTLKAYINALESLFLVERLEPWFQTDYDRISKQNKLFMTDSGLMASILGCNADQLYLDADRSGKLIETFAFNELIAQVDYAYGEYTMSHYRDRQKREIDFIIENRAGELVGIEIKSGSNVGVKDFGHLKWFKENIAKNRPFKGIVLYTGEHIAPFGEDMLLVPFGAMWA